MFNSKWERDSKTFFVGKAGIHDFLLASEASLLTRLPFGQKSNAAKCHDRLTFSLQAFKFHLETFLFCQTRSGEVSSRGAFNGLCCKVYHSSRGKALKTLSCVLLLLKCWEWTSCEKYVKKITVRDQCLGRHRPSSFQSPRLSWHCWCFDREGFLGPDSRAWRLGACGFALCFPERVVEGGATGARQPRPFSPSSAAAVAISCVCVHSNTLFINWVQEMLPPSTMFTLHFLLMWHRPTVLCDIVTFNSIFSGTVCDGVTGTPILCGGRTHQLHSLLRVIERDLWFTHSPHILPQTFISLFAYSCRVWKVEPSVETCVTLPGPRFNQPTIRSPTCDTCKRVIVQMKIVTCYCSSHPRQLWSFCLQ